MNNKSFYAIIAFAALCGLLFFREEYPTAELIIRIVICGGSLYYAYNQYRRRRRFTLLMLLMIPVAVLYNPIFPVSMPPVYWVIAHIVVMALFYFIARATPIEETIIVKREELEDEE